MDDKKKKKYNKPEADIVQFVDEDIILTSLTKDNNDPGWNTGDYWG